MWMLGGLEGEMPYNSPAHFLNSAQSATVKARGASKQKARAMNFCG